MKAREALRILEEIRGSIATPPEKQHEQEELLAAVERQIGQCIACEGTKTIIMTGPDRGSNFRERHTRDDKRRFEYPCQRCNAKGQVTELDCVSCGVPFEIEAFNHKRQQGLCEKCFMKLDQRTGLIPMIESAPAKFEKIKGPEMEKSKGKKK